MSVQSEIDRIKANVSSTYSVLESAGAEMPDEQSSDNLPGTASSITAVLYGKAQSLTDAQKAQARENIGLGEEYRAQLIQDVLDAIGCPVFGIVDENNNIILTGALADGSYNIKYEMEDGSTVDIGDLVLDTNVYYSVTSNLTNCTNSNSTKTVVEGESYSATISANSGYELKSVVVTMGGAAVTVTNGVINIASVTGDIVITAVAEEVVEEIVNLAVPNTTNTTDWNIWCNNSRIGSDGKYRSASGQSTTNYIEAAVGDTFYIKGMSFTANTHTMGLYTSAKEIKQVGTLTYWGNNYAHVETLPNGTISVTLTDNSVTRGVAYVKFSAALAGTANDVIITKNQPID